MKTILAFDVAQILNPAQIEKFGAAMGAVGIYLRPDRSTPDMAKRIADSGMALWSVYEKSYPTFAAYFTATQAKADATNAVSQALHLKQPFATQIFFAVDYDASSADILGPISEYFAVVHTEVRKAGYLSSVYGSGAVIEHLYSAGTAHSGWLAQSKRWRGYSPRCAGLSIIQGIETNMNGVDIDLDTVIDATALWRPN